MHARHLPGASSLALGLLVAAASPALAQGPTPVAADELAEIRAATEKYRDVEVALADGYIADPTGMCVTPDMEGEPVELGGMGIHYFRPDLLGITAPEPRVAGVGTHTDFLQPGILVYEPQADGSLELVAVENLVFVEGWKAAGHEAPPEFRGTPYIHRVDDPATEVDEAHGFEPHYELHMWLYRDNPAGLLAQYNTDVTCEHAVKADDHAGH